MIKTKERCHESFDRCREHDAVSRSTVSNSSTSRAFHHWLAAAWLSLAASIAVAQTAAPQRKAGWWEMAAHLPNGATLTRYLCLDRGFDARHSILSAQPGCTINSEKVAGG